MDTLLRYYWNQEKFKLYRNINGLFYFIRKIPGLGSILPETVYKSYNFKTILFLFLRIFSLPSRFLIKGFWILLHFIFACFWLNLLLTGEPSLVHIHPDTWLLGFLLLCLSVGFINRFSQSFQPFINKSDREFMQQFRLSHAQFIQSQLFVEPILTSLYYLPALLVYCVLTKNLLYLPVGLLIVPSGHFSGQALNRLLFNRKIYFKQHSWPVWASIAIGFGSFFLLILFRDSLSTSLLIPIFISQLILTWLGFRYIQGQTNHLNYLQYCMDQSMQLDQKIFEMTKGNEYTRQGLQMQAKLNAETGKDLSHLSGMTYLNALLFDRYKKVLYKKVQNWVLALVVILAALEGIRYFLEPFTFAEDYLLQFLPLSFMIMYVASSGKVVAQMVFVNCDISMLHYPFYREAKTIIAGFNYRFLQTCKLNLIFATSLFLVILILWRFALSWETILLTALLLLSLTALFSFHDLFIYYILQPFTKDMEVVNPVYKFLSGALYWVAYLNTQLDLGSHLYILLISLAMIAYVSIGYWILLKKAPRTFRLKA
ncbi:hypothetical protein HCC70_07085 [Streptococcus suis]|uniref:Pig-X/Pbn1 n=1 Tax=Streptococcus suivaginalis TaxID=3028082 RepID=A0AA97A0Z1_9STRE|nr:hypothetical protein [Streptococcus sp. 29896]MCK4028097.1 hypothetical protein [Streptococcus suis]WNY47285.1 hypothetical protein PXH68_00850 [Streptococcus sp. 29896]